MTYTSPTTINATKGFGEILTYINTVTNNWISNLILIAIYIIVIMGYYKAKGDFTGAFAVAGFGTFVVALLFWVAGFVSPLVLGIVIAVLIVGIALLLLEH